MINSGNPFPIRAQVILAASLLLGSLGELAAAQEQTPSDPPVRRIIATTQPLLAAAQEQTPSGLPGQVGTAAANPPGTVGTGGANPLFLELRTFSNLTRVTGLARDRSFLTAGHNNAVDFSYMENFGLGVRRAEILSVFRYTDDLRVDPERNSLQRAYFRISGPNSEYNFGDYLVSYSRLTYSQNVKGLHFIRKFSWGQGFRLMGNAGTFTDRYGSLFKDRLPGKPFTRVVSGLRAEQRLDVDKTIGINWAYGNDIVRSIPLDPLTGTEPFIPVANQVVSFDAQMTFARIWTLSGEAAYSITNRDTRLNHDTHPSSGNRKDYAFRLDNSIRSGPWNFDVFYTRIMPSFMAVNARQVADLQDTLVRASLELSRQLTVQGTYRRTTDDLRQQNRNPETVFQMPEFRLSFRDLPGLGSSLLDLGYRERWQKQATIADRVTRTPFVEISIPISSSVLTLGFEHRANLDRLNPSNQTSANDATVAFRSIFDVGEWTFTPLLRYEHNREMFDRVATGNNTRTVQAALMLDTPKYFTFEAMYRELGATLFQDQPVLDPQTFQPVLGLRGLPEFMVTGPSGFRRPALRLAVTYKLFNNEDRRITFSFERNNNLFAVANQDFLERVMQVTVVWRFRRQ